jgi:hypothetical protein
MNSIFCFGDGYAHGHIWPEWPQLLKAIYPEVTVHSTTGIGAGNEFLINAVLSQCAKGIPGVYLVQWAIERRLDKLISSPKWNSVISADPTYSENIVALDNNNWWLSSASKQKEVRDYHNFYIESTQDNLRTYNYMILLKNYFENNKIPYYFMFTNNPTGLTEIQKNNLQNANWAWHKPWAGMSEYSDQTEYKNIRQNQVQPAPPIHLDWLIDCLLDKIPYNLDRTRLKKLKQLVSNTQWIPYYWDRKAQWENLLSLL